MSGTQVSGFADPNILYKALSGMGTAEVQRNQLLNQQTQQEVTDHDIAAVGQAAAPLLNLSEDDAAKAYPGWLQDQQSRGIAKYAPPTYPGHAAVQALVQRAMPILQQIQTGYVTPPGSADATKRINDIYSGGGTPPPAPASSGAPSATGGGVAANAGALRDQLVSTLGVSPVDAGAILSNFHAESGLNAGINEIHPVIPGSRGGYGLAQWTGPRRDALEAFAQQNKLDVSQPGTQLAFMKQELQQPEYAGVLKAMQAAQTPEEKAAVFFHGYLSGNAPSLEHNLPGHVARASAYAGLPAAQAGAPPPGQPTAPGTPAPYRVASNAPVPPPASTAPAAGDLVGPRPLPPMGPGSPVVTPQSLANTPAPQPQAQIPQPPANRAMPGAPDGPPAPTPPPVQQPPPAPRANLPRAADVPQGLNSPQIQQAQRWEQAASQIEVEAARNPFDKRLQADAAAKAADLRQRAQTLRQTDTVVQTQDGQLHVATGAIDKTAAPLPHYVYDPTQHAYIDTTGTNKPEFEPAQRDSAVAQRDVMELGPKVANGTATPQEQARYATAVETYRQPELRENPVTKETVRVNKRELPAGFPEPTGLGGGGSGGAGASGGSNVVMPGLSPAQQQIERDKGRYDIAIGDLNKDRGEIASISDAGRAAQQDNLRVQEMRDILKNANTGPGTETAAHLRAWIARWTPGELTRWDGSGANLNNAAAIEMFQKLGFVGAVTQERGATSRGGYAATKLFQQFNPGAQMLTSTNEGLLAQRLIANQAEADYAQAAQDHYNTQHQRLKSPEQEYDPLSSFDAKWQAQRNPQVYAAAIGALGGQDGEIWSAGLSKGEIQRVKEVVARADPKAVVNMPGDAPTGRNRPPLTSFQR